MTDMTPTRPGQANGSGAADALFLKLFAGETLTAFAEATKSLDKHVVRTISGGKSAQS